MRIPTFRPVMQTKFGGGLGNCMIACLASMLGVPLEEVPDIPPTDPTRPFKLDAWLKREWGLRLAHLHGDPVLLGIAAIRGGPGPRGFSHACIYVDETLLHDPHPEGGGLLSMESYYLITPSFGVGHEMEIVSAGESP